MDRPKNGIVCVIATVICLLPLSPALGQEKPAVPLSAVKFWAYQIQGLETPAAVDALAASKYDLLVLEPTRTVQPSDDNSKFNARQMVQRLKAGTASDGAHRKLVVAYLSIGEAEDWRWYWTWSKKGAKGKGASLPPDWPPFIAGRDPDGWGGCYPVVYWDKQWKDIVLVGKGTPPAKDRDYSSIMDEVLKDGFDGVYLDWVEAYEDKHVSAAAKKAGVDPLDEMVKFIGEIRDLGRKTNPNFLVIQQNAAALIGEKPEIAKYVDGIGQEDTWYLGDATDKWDNPKGYDKPQKPGDTKDILANLDKYVKAGKAVLTIDYTVSHADEVYAKARAKGFVPYCSRTPLSRLTTTPPFAAGPAARALPAN
jgi:cysteinyl-tRNA synthetase, unknown class